jgi:hypothetical protein
MIQKSTPKKPNRPANGHQKDEVAAAIDRQTKALTQAFVQGFVLLVETRPERTLDNVRIMRWYQEENGLS